MAKFAGLKAKTCKYLIDDSSEDQKAKGSKKCDIKKILEFEIVKTALKQQNLRIEKNLDKNLEKNKTDIDSFFCYKEKH